MEDQLPTNSYKDARAQNLLENRYITIHLSDRTLAQPLMLRCLFCGDHLNLSVHRVPDAVVDTLINNTDSKPLVDTRCTRCKVSYRLIE
jgi:hypothetical protein